MCVEFGALRRYQAELEMGGRGASQLRVQTRATFT